MKRLVASVLGVCVLVGAGQPGAQEKARAGAQPQYGGVLTWFVYGDPGRLDIHTESPLAVQQATAGVYSGLLQHDPDDPSRIIGDLAERWTASPAALPRRARGMAQAGRADQHGGRDRRGRGQCCTGGAR